MWKKPVSAKKFHIPRGSIKLDQFALSYPPRSLGRMMTRLQFYKRHEIFKLPSDPHVPERVRVATKAISPRSLVTCGNLCNASGAVGGAWRVLVVLVQVTLGKEIRL